MSNVCYFIYFDYFYSTFWFFFLKSCPRARPGGLDIFLGHNFGLEAWKIGPKGTGSAHFTWQPFPVVAHPKLRKKFEFKVYCHSNMVSLWLVNYFFIGFYIFIKFQLRIRLWIIWNPLFCNRYASFRDYIEHSFQYVSMLKKHEW